MTFPSNQPFISTWVLGLLLVCAPIFGLHAQSASPDIEFTLRSGSLEPAPFAANIGLTFRLAISPSKTKERIELYLYNISDLPNRGRARFFREFQNGPGVAVLARVEVEAKGLKRFAYVVADVR
jgi:hypothetical protein